MINKSTVAALVLGWFLFGRVRRHSLRTVVSRPRNLWPREGNIRR
jgi:hypothetical protein